MVVKLAEKWGFCAGVRGAIALAERVLREKGPGKVYSLGPVIHNAQVCEQLERAGLLVVEDVDQIPPGSTVLIRSHGVSPEVLERIRARGLEIDDATCPLVKRAQNVVKTLCEEGYRVVMIGEREHPEVRGIVGYGKDVIIVDSAEEIDNLVPTGARLGIVAQTTHSPGKVGELIGYIASKPFRELKVVNTLCLEVARRQQAAERLCEQVEVMFVLGGLHSANTRKLAEICRSRGVPTYHLESWQQFRPEMVAGRNTAGVTAGASTPDWIVQEFVENLSRFEPQ